MEAKKDVPVPVIELESEESSTEEAEVESPRSVVVEMKKKVERVHSQVLRIREEESHLGEDLVGRNKENENDVVVVVRGGFHEKRRRAVNVVLACSPLSGKNNVKRLAVKLLKSITSINQSRFGFFFELYFNFFFLLDLFGC
ncbi:hypothetical protein CXB51_017614 [Gossypium anomalum]|uniref:Uncharacterized protein n=1 Tax=Gossypium anomalum TaxID=47600 RepID=A0A8J6CZS9_9ROSI|nr:hypothetical protein CXB51_017614 [Gossypium anomalum]